MKNQGHVLARRIDDQYTEIRVRVDGIALTVPKTLDTTDVLAALMRCCGMTNLAAFGDFARQLQEGQRAEIQCYDLNGVAEEWGLQTIERSGSDA